MPRRTLPTALTAAALTLSAAGCTQTPPPAAPARTAQAPLPAGVTKTKKGVYKGKITPAVRSAAGLTPGIED